MSTIVEIINKQLACSVASGADTGKLGCQLTFATPKHLIAIQKGSKIPSGTTLNLAYIEPLVQAGTWIPIIGAASMEDVSSEDTFNTNSAGQDRLSLLGLPKYQLNFEEGHEFYRQLAKLTSFKSKDFIIIDTEGNWKLAVDTSGDYEGFSAGQVVAMMTKTAVQGGEPESKGFSVQFLDRAQWDKNYGIIEAGNLDFTPEDISAINGVDLAFYSVPAATDTTIEVTAVLSADKTTKVEGLIAADFQVKVDGTAVSISLLAEAATGVYTLTIPALVAAEVCAVDLYDTSLSLEVIVNTNVLYRGVSASETVTA